MESFFFGIVGFLGFEALRIYRKYHSSQPLFPQKNYIVYVIILVIISLFSGSVAYAFVKENITEAIFIGFSVPTNTKVIFEGAKGLKGINVDDTSFRKPNLKQYIKYLFVQYF